MRAALLLTSLLACTPGPATRPIAGDREVVAASEPAPGTSPRRAAVASCPATATPTETRFDPRIEVGLAGAVTWLFGYAGVAALAHLDPGGRLVTHPVPLHNASTAATLGPRVWLYAPDEGTPEAPARWAEVDVGDPEAPVAGPVQPLTLGMRDSHATALAVGSRRALVVAREAMVMLDPATRAAVAAPASVGPGFKPARASCDDDRCAVIGVSDEGGGPDRRLIVLRVGPDGAVEREQIAPGWISGPHTALAGERVIVAWQQDDGPRLRALDRRGRTVGGLVAVPVGVRHDREALLAGDGATVLAIAAQGRWRVTSVGPDANLAAPREVPGATLFSLLGAPLDDGLAWAGIDARVSHDEMGPGGPMTHSWDSRVVAGFLPTTGDAAAPIELTAGSGGGRGGFEVHLLARPGAAAAVVVPRGDADGPTRVFPLRAPCER